MIFLFLVILYHDAEVKSIGFIGSGCSSPTNYSTIQTKRNGYAYGARAAPPGRVHFSTLKQNLDRRPLLC